MRLASLQVAGRPCQTLEGLQDPGRPCHTRERRRHEWQRTMPPVPHNFQTQSTQHAAASQNNQVRTTCAGAVAGADVPAASGAAAGAGAGASVGETVVEGGARVCAGLDVRGNVRLGSGCVAGTGARGRVHGGARGQTGTIVLGAPSAAGS